jgi:hypothetical protein
MIYISILLLTNFVEELKQLKKNHQCFISSQAIVLAINNKKL